MPNKIYQPCPACGHEDSSWIDMKDVTNDLDPEKFRQCMCCDFVCNSGDWNKLPRLIPCVDIEDLFLPYVEVSPNEGVIQDKINELITIVNRLHRRRNA